MYLKLLMLLLTPVISDQGLGLKVPRGQKNSLSLDLDEKVLRISTNIFVLIAINIFVVAVKPNNCFTVF